MSNDSAQVAHLKRQCKTVITPLSKKKGGIIPTPSPKEMEIVPVRS